MRAELAPDDVALLDAWARGESQEEAVSLADAISEWAEGAEEDEARLASLVALLDHCADATVQMLHDGDAEAMEALAEALVPLRVALLRWPAAATLPPFGMFLGCLQALLRGEEGQLARLAAALDEGLAGALARVVELVGVDDRRPTTDDRPRIAGDDGRAGGVRAAEGSGAPLPAELEAALAQGNRSGVERVLGSLAEGERERALRELRRRAEARVTQMSAEEQRALAIRLRQEQIERAADDAATLAEQTLREGDGNGARALAIQMGQAAAHYAEGEERGAPYDELAAFMRGIAAVLRGTPVPPVPPQYAARIAALQALAAGEAEL
jgi:hypothetical protein